VLLLDFVGDSYDFTANDDGSFSFTLNDTAYGMGFSGTTYENDTSVLYSASQVDESSSSTPTATPTPTETNAASLTIAGGRFHVTIGCLFFVIVIWV
jgi:hypothetical protein